jgi:hypothetical protein
MGEGEGGGGQDEDLEALPFIPFHRREGRVVGLSLFNYGLYGLFSG